MEGAHNSISRAGPAWSELSRPRRASSCSLLSYWWAALECSARGCEQSVMKRQLLDSKIQQKLYCLTVLATTPICPLKYTAWYKILTVGMYAKTGVFGPGFLYITADRTWCFGCWTGKRWAVLPTSYGIPSSSLCAANDAAVGEGWGQNQCQAWRIFTFFYAIAVTIHRAHRIFYIATSLRWSCPLEICVASYPSQHSHLFNGWAFRPDGMLTHKKSARHRRRSLVR